MKTIVMTTNVTGRALVQPTENHERSWMNVSSTVRPARHKDEKQDH